MTKQSSILIVDDNESGRKTLDNLLYQDYHLIFAESGFDALVLADKYMPDLILLDIMMPGMDGFEVCRRLRADKKLEEIPVIMLTMLDDTESKIEGLKAGADDFISKPFISAELEARISTVTKLNRYKRLLAERSKVEWIINQAQAGFVIISSDDRIIFANRRARLYLDIYSEHFHDKTISFIKSAQSNFNLVPEEDWKKWNKLINTEQIEPLFMVRPESTFSQSLWLEVKLLNPSGSKDDEKVISLIDITREIENAYNIRSFTGLVSHKLRTPLVNILFTYDMIKKKLPQDEENEALLVNFEEDINNLRSIIDNVMNFLETPNFAKVGDNFDTDMIQSFMMGTFMQDYKSVHLKDLRIINNLDENNRKTVLSINSIKYIFDELIENSIKFHPEHKPDVTIAFSENEGMLEIEYSDDGINLMPEQLSNIWAPYYQVEKVFTGEIKGMGLGLSTLALVIWQVGGKCKAENRKDGNPGITIQMIIPYAE